MSRLNPEILKIIKKKTGMGEQAIRNAISTLKNTKFPRTTQNAAAQLFAQIRGFSVAQKLKTEDRNTLPNIELEKPVKILRKENKSPQKKKIIEFVTYTTQNKFLRAHLDEINRCYTHNCYTASFILIRKVIENLITEMIKKKFPNNTKQEKELYLDLAEGRTHDLSILIKNLRNKASAFDPQEKKLVLRILQLSEQFKDDANDKTHSLYHISNKTELDNKNPQMIFDLITEYFK